MLKEGLLAIRDAIDEELATRAEPRRPARA
jgi:hypothetical protein